MMQCFQITLFVVCSVLFFVHTNAHDNYRPRSRLTRSTDSTTEQSIGDRFLWGSSNRQTGVVWDLADERPNWGTSNRETTNRRTNSGERQGETSWDPLVDRPSWNSGNRRISSGDNRRVNSGERQGGINRDSIDDRPGGDNTNRRTNSGSNNRRVNSGERQGGSSWNSGEDRFNFGGNNRRTNSNQEASNRRGSNSALPDRSTCGFQEVDRILDGEVTGLREFPWMALLQYRKKTGNLVFSCGGTLISSRYVLTAAHCVKGQILTKIGPLINVRLGEYNTETEKDCSTQLGFEICNDKPIDSEIDKIVVHPGYSESSTDRQNDIALIKLKTTAPTTDFVKPICLPTRTEKSNVGDRLVVAGWGRTEYSSNSSVKLKLRVPIAASSQCTSKFRSAGVTLGNKQLCAGGERGRDSCNGDSGGPLMSTTKNDTAQWYIEGIVSFGAKCGSEGWPGIYTRVSDYVDWIKNNVD